MIFLNKSRLCLCGVILTLIAIFYFSSQSNLVSTKYSNAFIGNISKVYSFVYDKSDSNKSSEVSTKSVQDNNTKNNNDCSDKTSIKKSQLKINSTLARKSAHVFLYCVLGMFFSLMLYFSNKKNNFVIILTLIFGFIIGSLDEINQSFYKYRGSSFRDVIIDVMGVTIALIIWYLSTKLLKNRKFRGI